MRVSRSADVDKRQQGDAPDQPSGREPAQQGTYSGEWRSLLQLGNGHAGELSSEICGGS
jgi:hypothetical protein